VAIVLVGLVLGVVQHFIGNYIANSLVQVPSNRVPVRHIWTIGTSLLHDLTVNLVMVGALVVLLAILAGATRPAVAVRRFVAPAFVARPAAIWSGAGLTYLLLLFWQPMPVLGTWVGGLTLAVVFAAGVVAMRRQCQREFPDAHFAGLGSVGAAITGAWHSLTNRRDKPAPPPATDGSIDNVEQLTRVAALHTSGALDDEEYAAAKRKLLGLTSVHPAPTG
jgi:hypothetical protein